MSSPLFCPLCRKPAPLSMTRVMKAAERPQGKDVPIAEPHYVYKCGTPGCTWTEIHDSPPKDQPPHKPRPGRSA